MECVGYIIAALVFLVFIFFCWFWWSLFNNSRPKYTENDLFDDLWKKETDE